MSLELWHVIVNVNQFIYLYFRSLAWHKVLQVNLFCTLLKKCWLWQLINLQCMYNILCLLIKLKYHEYCFKVEPDLCGSCVWGSQV